MRQQFTDFWNSLGSKYKSILISIGAIGLSSGVLYASKLVYPSYDFSQIELIVVTGIGGFITSVIKDFVKISK